MNFGRTEREIERRLDDNDFRKKYFLFQKLPSFLFEVVFSNERQLKCRSLMLVSEKLVANLGKWTILPPFIITINGCGIYTAPCVMILMWANPYEGHCKGPEHLDFFGP